eukprot:3318806-Rhodomonas_salina.2
MRRGGACDAPPSSSTSMSSSSPLPTSSSWSGRMKSESVSPSSDSESSPSRSVPSSCHHRLRHQRSAFSSPAISGSAQLLGRAVHQHHALCVNMMFHISPIIIRSLNSEGPAVSPPH